MKTKYWKKERARKEKRKGEGEGDWDEDQEVEERWKTGGNVGKEKEEERGERKEQSRGKRAQWKKKIAVIMLLF